VRLEFDAQGVCTSPRYFRQKDERFTLRNVPGDGDCMFLAVALATQLSMGLDHSVTGEDDLPRLESMAQETRNVVSRVLQSSGSLVIDKDQPPVSARALLASAVAKEDTTTEDYLERLETIGRLGGMYGGGPELAVLSNILRRPISIFELASDDLLTEKECRIERQGTFGCFDDPLPEDSAIPFSWHLHILVVDVSPHEKHACVLLPEPEEKGKPDTRQSTRSISDSCRLE
jgi:hypothetical protein